jgi:F420-dependent oxidoreductase-like protein
MRIGLQLPFFNFPGGTAEIGPTLKRIAQTADQGGFYSLWVMDHFFQMEMLGSAELNMLESYSTLSYLAAVTEKVKLGTMVTGVIYRHPGVLLKTVSTLDVLSGGRAYLGIGAAWYEREALGLGVPYPETTERFERLEETLQIAHQMWAEKIAPFDGKHYHLKETLNHPQPISQPHPPILIGGVGEKKTLRFVAQYADACNLFAQIGIDTMREKLTVLKQHCDDLGRPYEQIEKTSLDTVNLATTSPAEVLTKLRQLADIGIQQAIFNMPNAETITPLEVFAREIIPVVKDW